MQTVPLNGSGLLVPALLTLTVTPSCCGGAGGSCAVCLRVPRAVHSLSRRPGRGCTVASLSPAEVQLKPKHQPYKLGRQWPELLLRFTDAPDDDVATGERAPAAPPQGHLG